MLDRHLAANVLDRLWSQKASFSLHDPIYPSPSDPGAYISYSAEGQSNARPAWLMSLGNHGCSGGIYAIEHETIIVQLVSLAGKSLISNLKLGKDTFFSRYSLQSENASSDTNALLLKLHTDISNR